MKQPKVEYVKLGKEKAWGMYNSEGTIKIDPRLRGKKKLDIFIHEYTHHFFPYIEEEDVEAFATHIADFLWKHHVRFVDNEKTEE